MDMLKQLSLAGLVPVIKVKKAEDAVPLCRALKNGGLPVAEITFRTDAAEEAIRLVHEELPEVLLGAALPTSRVCHLSLHTGPFLTRGSALGLMLCCCCHEFLILELMLYK